MTSQQKQEIFVPILISSEEYNQIIKSPPHMHQQLFQETYSKLQQQTQLQTQQQIHSNLQFQQLSYNQSQNPNAPINIPNIPTHPNQYPQVNIQGLQYPNQNIQQQQQYQNQNLIVNLNQVVQQQQVQSLKHSVIPKAGNLELKYFYEWFSFLFTIEISISLLINTISALFGWELVTGYYQWSTGLWIILSLFIILNLFILTNPTFVTHSNNQKLFYWIHVILYVLLLQGLQIAVSGNNRICSWYTNFFYQFYLIICVEFISLRYSIKRFGLKQPIKKYTFFIVFPPIMAYSIEFLKYYSFFYFPLFLWVFVVMLIGIGYIQLINKIVDKGYNNFQTNHIFAMAISLPMLMINPFYDDE